MSQGSSEGKSPQRMIWMITSSVLLLSLLTKNRTGVAACIVLVLAYYAMDSFMSYKEEKARIELIKAVLCLVAALIFGLYYASLLV